MDLQDETASAAALPSIDDFDAVTLGETPHEFEWIISGRRTGIFVSVYGSQATRVQDALNAINNDQRKASAAAAAAAEAAGETYVRDIGEAVDATRQAAAVRVAGWRGLKERCTPETALRMCRRNEDFAAACVQKSNDFGNFIKVSLPKP